MTKRFILSFITVLTLAVSSLPVAAQNRETGDTITVVATGIGKDQEAALKNALRSAVEQAVGVLVSAETLVDNDQLIKDKILTFSGGFVQSYQQVGTPSTEDGLVSVRIAAEVKRTDLRDKLQSEGVIKIAVNPNRLRFEILTKEKAQKDGVEMLLDLLEEFPLNTYDISGDYRYDASVRKVFIDVDIKIDMKKYTAFEKEFTDLTSKLGGARLGVQTQSIKSLEQKGVEFRWIDVPNGTKGHVVAFADRLPTFRMAGQENTFNFTLYTVPDEVWKMIAPMFDRRKRKIIIEAVDSGGNLLAMNKITFGRNNENLPEPPGHWLGANSATILFPWLSVKYPDIWFGSVSLYPAVSEYKLSVPLALSQGDMERITAVHISME